ncbi:hypothetical protein Trco_004746 [Trichoderma cornu-damae]|uniref:Uncharacterized protein n=1 Tax=Trichoderma cornu-damae TaxID=654480 RepID=A0A9P8QMX0_9HYPO|nr:hypothetical protein Trco_004746 [Trichoderma cornu-damae]
MYTSSCNTTSTNGNGTSDYTRSHTYPYPLPTTFETSTTAKGRESGSRGFAYPLPTVRVTEEELPRNPNYPWGADSPLHRHQNVTGLGDGLFGESSGLGDWGKTIATRLRALFKKQAEKDQSEGGEE